MLYEHRFYGGGLLLQFFMLCEHRDWRGRQPTILYALRAWGLAGATAYNSLCSASMGVMGGLLLQFFMLYEHPISGNKDCYQQIVVDDQEL